MRRNHQPVSDNGAMVFLLAILNAIVLEHGLVSHPKWYWMLLVTVPLLFGSILFRKSYKGLALLRRTGLHGKVRFAGRTKHLTLNKFYRHRKRKSISSSHNF